jgi:hypothetical protein
MTAKDSLATEGFIYILALEEYYKITVSIFIRSLNLGSPEKTAR